MAASNDGYSFDRFHTSVKQFNVSGKTLLLPHMASFASPLFGAAFRAFGVNAQVMETYKGLTLGREFTSGKECFPCQVTLGDILRHLQKEKERLGSTFDSERYVYFMPESDGPCRFGMYNKLQRLILDRFEEFKDVPILYLSTKNAYATEGILPPEHSSAFRKLSYVAIVIGDTMDRILWRVRPYELRKGMTDAFLEEALEAMSSLIERAGAGLDFNRIYRLLGEIAATARSFIDPHQPRRPLIGIVGEIYLRNHNDSNQNIIRHLEQFGGEVVDASVGEWINFVCYERARKLRRRWKIAWRTGDHPSFRRHFRQWLGHEIEKFYQTWRQKQVYRVAARHLDIHPEHSIRTIERRLDKKQLFNFEIGTEAALSIGSSVECAHHGFDGIVNVFPFTCMPSTITSAILKPLLHRMRIPYLDAPYDGSIQPNREVALRTFLYQANQHFESRIAGRNGKARK